MVSDQEYLYFIWTSENVISGAITWILIWVLKRVLDGNADLRGLLLEGDFYLKSEVLKTENVFLTCTRPKNLHIEQTEYCCETLSGSN